MSSKSLRDIIRRGASKDSIFDSIFDPITRTDKYDDRSSVIVMVSILEVGLERLLKSRMRRLGPEDADAVFSGTGPLSTFSAKVRIAYALGLIGPITRHDLATFNDIRNVFAHAPHKVTLQNERLWNRVSGIHMIKSSRQNRSERALHYRLSPSEKRMTRRKELLYVLGNYALMLSHSKHKRIKIKPYKGDYWGFKNGGTLDR